MQNIKTITMYNDNQILGNNGSEICQLLTAGSRTVVFEWNELTVLDLFYAVISGRYYLPICIKAKTNITNIWFSNLCWLLLKRDFSECTQFLNRKIIYCKHTRGLSNKQRTIPGQKKCEFIKRWMCDTALLSTH